MFQLFGQFKPAAREKAAAKPKAKAKAQTISMPSGKRNKAVVVEPRLKHAVGAAPGGGGQKRKFDEVLSLTSEDHHLELSAADKEVCDGFRSRVRELRKLSPPLAEHSFKSYLQETLSQCSQFMTDLKTKQRSAKRRSNADDDLLWVEIERIESSMRDHITLVKCSLTL